MFGITRIFRYAIRFSVWVTPHVQEWHRRRHLNRVEAERHLESRNWAEAEKLFNVALTERKHSSKRLLGLMLGLEKSQRRQGKLAEAEQTARSVIDLAVKSRSHQMRVRAMDALVDILLDQKKYAEAEVTIAEIASLEEAQAKPDHALLAASARKLGTALLKGGRNVEAMEAFQKSVTLSEKALGADHLETAKSVAEMGMIQRAHSNHSEAQRHLRRALQIHRKVSGADSHEATEGLQNLAASLEESGDLDGAVGEYERLLGLKERQVGGNRVQTAEVQVRLAVLYLHRGQNSRARELLTHATGVLEKRGGPQFAVALEAMADVEEQSGHSAAAKGLREKAAALVAQEAGAHPATESV